MHLQYLQSTTATTRVGLCMRDTSQLYLHMLTLQAEVTAHKAEFDNHTDYQAFSTFRDKSSIVFVTVSPGQVIFLLPCNSPNSIQLKKIIFRRQIQKLTLYMAPVPNFHFLHSLTILLSVPWKKKQFKQMICPYSYHFLFAEMFTALPKRKHLNIKKCSIYKHVTMFMLCQHVYVLVSTTSKKALNCHFSGGMSCFSPKTIKCCQVDTDLVE